MSIITSQQLAHYFEQYKSTDVTFNKQVIAATGLVARNVYLKLLDRQIPCIVFSSSMSGAKVIASIKSSVFAALKQNNNRLALRWCFKLPDKAEPITFFVTCHASAFTHYAVQDPDVQIMTLEFTQHPPDDLIQILGTLLEASCNAQRRKDERIVITPETMKKLGLESREASLIVDGTAHLCVLRDLSFSGAKVLAPGFAATLAGQDCQPEDRQGRTGRGDDPPRRDPPHRGGGGTQGYSRRRHRVLLRPSHDLQAAYQLVPEHDAQDVQRRGKNRDGRNPCRGCRCSGRCRPGSAAARRRSCERLRSLRGPGQRHSRGRRRTGGWMRQGGWRTSATSR